MCTKKCKHFWGNRVRYKCLKEHKLDSVVRDECFGDKETTCIDYSPPTAEEIAAEDAAITHAIECRAKNISPCCEAPIDESRVIKSGRYKGHGGRYCSKCGKCIFFV